MDLVLKDLKVENFRSIKSLNYVFENQNLILGSCNHGKTAVIEAICLAIGCTEWITEEDRRDFFIDKKMLLGDPESKVYSVVVTISGFKENNPKLYPDWFEKYKAHPFWWDEYESRALSSRTDESQSLACKIAYIAQRNDDGSLSHKRYFLSEDESLEVNSSNPHVPSDFFDPLAVVYFPLICLEWVEEFNETKKKLLKETESWWDKQVGNLESVTKAVDGMNRFMERVKQNGQGEQSVKDTDVALMNEAKLHMEKMYQAIDCIEKASSEPEEKVLLELAKVLPWCRVSPDSEKEYLKALEDPSFEDMLNFLVHKSQSSGAGKAFEPMVQVLLDKHKAKENCIIIFDEVEHFIPDKILYPFMDNLLKLARQSVFISHDTRLVNFFGANEIKDIDNQDGNMVIETSDPFTLPELSLFSG